MPSRHTSIITRPVLRPHQIPAADHLLCCLQQHGAAVDFSDCGVGKTYVAMSVIKRMNLPTLVIGPKIAEAAWHRTAKNFGDTISYIGFEKLATGRTPYGEWANQPPKKLRNPEIFICQSCQREVDFDNFVPCYVHPIGAHCVTIRKKPWKYGKFNFSPTVGLLVFDEAHRCGGVDSLNAEMLIAARRQGIPTLALSATAASTPLKMRALGYLLGLHSLMDFYRWVRRYGCERDTTFGGFRWNVGTEEQRTIMSRLNAEINPSKGVRLRCEEIPDFPKLDVSAELYTIGNPKECDAAYAELKDALDRHDVTRSSDKNPELALTKILRARQKIELLKVPALIELAKDYMEKGFVVPIFVNFSETVNLLAEKLRLPVIDGSVSGERRTKIIEALKRDEYRGVIVNSAAGGVSVDLHDVRGEFPRMGLVMPHPSAVVMIQVLGRLRRDGGKSVAHYRIILADKTIETKVYKSFNASRDNLSALNDGDLSPF